MQRVVSLGQNTQRLKSNRRNLWLWSSPRHHLFSCLCSVLQQHFPWITSIILWVSSYIISFPFITCLQRCCSFFLGKVKAFLLLPRLRPPADLHLTCRLVDRQQRPPLVLVAQPTLAGLAGCPKVCGVQTVSPGSLLALQFLASESLGIGPTNLFFFPQLYCSIIGPGTSCF